MPSLGKRLLSTTPEKLPNKSLRGDYGNALIKIVTTAYYTPDKDDGLFDLHCTRSVICAVAGWPISLEAIQIYWPVSVRLVWLRYNLEPFS